MLFEKIIDINIECQSKYKIDHSRDAFYAIGELIKLSQELECEYKKLGEKLGKKAGSLNNLSLNKINNMLNSENKISSKDYDNLRQVIKIRNYINHWYFINEFAESYERQEKILNICHMILLEGSDVVNNLIDNIDGVGVVRPTIFDSQNN